MEIRHLEGDRRCKVTELWAVCGSTGRGAHWLEFTQTHNRCILDLSFTAFSTLFNEAVNTLSVRRLVTTRQNGEVRWSSCQKRGTKCRAIFQGDVMVFAWSDWRETWPAPSICLKRETCSWNWKATAEIPKRPVA